MAELVTQDGQGRWGIAESSSGFRAGQTFDQKRPERLVLAVRGVGGLQEEVSVPSFFSIIQDLSLLYDNTILNLSLSTLFGRNTEKGPKTTQGPAGPILMKWRRRALGNVRRWGHARAVLCTGRG
jgi:hypothetical protein